MSGAWEQSPSVLTAVLHTEMTTMAWSLGLRKLLPLDMPILPVTGRPYDMGRNFMCQQMLDHGFDWLFMLDSDVIPPPDAILRLMSHNLPLVSGVYHRRSPPHGLPVMCRNGKFMESYPANSLIEVDVVGAGCLLIRRDLLEAMKPIDPVRGKHWFDWRVDMAHMLPPGEGLSEDFAFNLHVRRQLGVKIIVDTGVQAKHVGLSEAYFGGLKPCEAIG